MRANPRYGNTIATHEELGEVPGQVFGAIVSRLGGTQILVEITGIVAVDFHLAEHGEVHVVFFFGELCHLGIAARLLATKLVAGKSQYGKSLGLKLFLKGTQTCVLIGESSL